MWLGGAGKARRKRERDYGACGPYNAVFELDPPEEPAGWYGRGPPCPFCLKIQGKELFAS